jgi:ribosomal protein S18 acetylase RimI-like enzyme
MSEIRAITPDDVASVERFNAELSTGDRTFLKEAVGDDTAERWSTPKEGVWRWGLFEDGVLMGLLAIVRGTHWSAHVGELRLVVGSPYRRRGIGRALSRHGLSESLKLGLDKIVVEVIADEQGTITMFSQIGFRPEALLEGHIIDREGRHRDLVVLAHQVSDHAAMMAAVGMDDALGQP